MKMQLIQMMTFIDPNHPHKYILKSAWKAVEEHIEYVFQASQGRYYTSLSDIVIKLDHVSLCKHPYDDETCLEYNFHVYEMRKL
jgi:hypothetical protein